jgi:hypothetical protein
MKRFLAWFIFLAILSIVNSTRAQTVDSAHNHAHTQVTDGAVNPELIPDSTAYRLYFAMVSRPFVPSDDQVKRQKLEIGRVGLQEFGC